MTRETAINRLRYKITEIRAICDESKHMSEDDRQDMETFDMAIKALEQEPTTKNDLGVDREQLKNMIRGLTKWYVKRDNAEVGQPNTAVGLLYDDVMFGIDRLPSVTPQESFINKPCVSSGVCEYDKQKVLDKIRVEILDCLKALDGIEKSGFNIYLPNELSGRRLTFHQCLEIIDKYKAETEDANGTNE